MRNILLILSIALITLSCASKKDADWKLVWSDEFDYTGMPVDSIWDYELGYVRNSELQKYTDDPENVYVEDGICTITCKLEDDSTITSASITTRGVKDIKYGRVEVRAQIPSALGTWPAIWMLGKNVSDVGWPECGELDIMEHVGYDPHIIHANIHTKAYNHVNGITKGQTIEVEEPWNDFHVYAMNWYEDRIDFFYDDSLYHSYENDMAGDPATWPFAEPHYLIINLAFGGAWGGSKGVNLDALPLEYKIDYVRVFQ